MAINRSEIEKFFEEMREIRSIAIDTQCNVFEEEESVAINPKYIGVYLSNYYSKRINKKLNSDLLR